jgi:hypothetical protein
LELNALVSLSGKVTDPDPQHYVMGEKRAHKIYKKFTFSIPATGKLVAKVIF